MADIVLFYYKQECTKLVQLNNFGGTGAKVLQLCELSGNELEAKRDVILNLCNTNSARNVYDAADALYQLKLKYVEPLIEVLNWKSHPVPSSVMDDVMQTLEEYAASVKEAETVAAALSTFQALWKTIEKGSKVDRVQLCKLIQQGMVAQHIAPPENVAALLQKKINGS